MPVEIFIKPMANKMGNIIDTFAGGPIRFIFFKPLPPAEEGSLIMWRPTPFVYFIIACVVMALAFNLLIIGGSVVLIVVIIYGYVILFRKIKAFNNLETVVNTHHLK